MGMTTARSLVNTISPVPVILLVKSYLNADRSRTNIHLWSPAPASLDRGYHEIWG
jgi:hypothetical protein